MTAAEQLPVPVQAGASPILGSPFDEPSKYWVFETETGQRHEAPGRRPAGYYYKRQRTGRAQLSLFAEEERDDLPLVNALRDDVRRWRERGYESATPVTKQLLAHWNRTDRYRQLFFCQHEAVETIIYLNEILASGRSPRWTPKLSLEDYRRLTRGEPAEQLGVLASSSLFPTLADRPADASLEPLLRYGCKMATGSGKTVVMAMLIAWAFCNRGRSPSDERFPNAAVAVCPNLTILERLQVLRPDSPDNYYTAFDLVPSTLMPELKKGRVLVLNWHKLAPEGSNVEGGQSYRVVDKGEESADAFAQRVLGELYERGPVMVLNDEAHHAYRPKPLPQTEKLDASEKEERQEATVWVEGLDRINAACGIRFCVDLSATPFYLHGSGYVEGSPLPWLVSDFGLVDAIESGIVKIPRLPISDTTGRPEPKYYALWRHITQSLHSGEKLPGGKPKPEVVWREAEDALQTLASQYQERFDLIAAASPGQDHTPPVLIVVCDNTDIARLFYERISGEQVVAAIDVEDDEDDEAQPTPRRRKSSNKTRTVYGTGGVFPQLFSNHAGFRPTLRIDSKLLNEAESENGSRSDAAEALREIVATVGRPGKPGAQIRCVVSVQMLTEGWDANSVTHILGLRAFDSQLLCEQVIGRGLRRMRYDVDPETGMLPEEYVDIYGVPFSLIPFRGREAGKSANVVDRPKNHVRSLPQRAAYELRFPVVEGYAFALRRNQIVADVARMQPLRLEPDDTPTAVFVEPQVGFRPAGTPAAASFHAVEHDRDEYYASTHLQTITFEIARRVVWTLTEGSGVGRPKLRLRARHQLFPQVYRYVERYVDRKVDFQGCDPRELGLEIYVGRIVERLVDAIRPDEAEGEPPLLPILNRYRPIGSTANVDFLTTRPVYPAIYSHLNQVVADTGSWEQIATMRLDQAVNQGLVRFHARNDHLEFTIPYEYEGNSHSYDPDFLVRLADDSTLVLEVKGYENDQALAKHEAARRWIDAVNTWGQLGVWRFHVCKNPNLLLNGLAILAADEA